MSYPICLVKNIDVSPAVYAGKSLAADEEYQILDNDRLNWSHNDNILSAITTDKLQIGDGNNFLVSYDSQIEWLKANAPIEALTEVNNNHTLLPLGMLKSVFTVNNFSTQETLSNKSGTDFDCTGSPAVGDCLFQSNGTNRAYITAVNAGTITVDKDVLANGAAVSAKPKEIDFELPTDSTYYYLWGFMFDSINMADDDFVKIQIVDTYNVLGYGAGFVIKTYDELWVKHLNNVEKMLTPDGAPGELLQTFTIRLQYYSAVTTATTIHAWVDWIVTEKE